MEEEQNNNVQPQEAPKETSKVEKKGFNITSMILGIIAILFSVTQYSLYVTLPCGIIAIIFSIAGRKDAGRGMGITGLVLGIIALVIFVLILILGFWAISQSFNLFFVQ